MNAPLDAHSRRSMHLGGQVALVTGGRKDIGLAAARAKFETLSTGRIIAIAADVCDPKEPVPSR
jgi:NAD(P)-dependent dehydrogenase (short-subunit alcohol dehydrogenase family)